MSEEEIIDRVIRINSEKAERSMLGYTFEVGDREAIQGLLDLYNKEKEKNKLLIEGKFRANESRIQDNEKGISRK